DKSFPKVNFDAFRPQDTFNKHADVQQDITSTLVRLGLVCDMDAASTVLPKNVNGSLPRKKPITITLIG
ncbi:hypothetical protein BDV93DRAFT_429827, partial [Ceratobasidium sp. AG-I]